MPDLNPDMERAVREEARWRILRGLDFGRPYPVCEAILYRLLSDMALPVTLHQVRRELDYLEERGLVEIRGRDEDTWMATLTRTGVDVVEYTAPCEPGIARPPRR